MFFFYVGVIFQLVLIKGDKTSVKQLPPQLLEMSLKHMNMLLADISNQIDFERKLLSLREETKNFTDFSKKVDDSADDIWKRTVERYNIVEANKANQENQNVQAGQIGSLVQWSTKTPLPINKLFGEFQFTNGHQERNVYQQPKTQYIPDVRTRMNLDVVDARKFFPSSSTTMKLPTGNVMRKNLLTFINKENSKFCSHDHHGQHITVNDTELCRKTIMKMAKEGMLNYLEDLIMEGLKNLATATWTGQLDPARFNNGQLLSENSDVSLRARNKAKNTKSAYKKMMQHFILKHPSLFRQYAKHHKRGHKSKHHKSHHKRHHHKHKQQTQKHWKQYYPAHHIRANEIKKLPGNIIQSYTQINKLNPNILSRRSNNDNKIAEPSKTENKTKANSSYGNQTSTKEETKQKDSLTKPSTTKTTHSNKLVQMIRAESSYSDEELYLKTMLKDALYHSNFTTTSSPIEYNRVFS